MIINENGFLLEQKYDLADDAQNSSLFGTGNGYFGVRGSLEEFGPVFIQGCYIRGVFDQIIEIPQTFVDNEYLKKYYFDEQKLKEFEYEDSCINLIDFLNIRVKIGERTFYPWEGKVLKWERFINTDDGSLQRNVLWDDGFGNVTKLQYKRFASFFDNHLYVVKVNVTRINHLLPITISSGIDTFVKTNGQKKSKIAKIENKNRVIRALFDRLPKYNQQVALLLKNEFIGFEDKTYDYLYNEGIYYEKMTSLENEVSLCKFIYMGANIDYNQKYDDDLLQIMENSFKTICCENYDKIYNKHLQRYQDDFSKINISMSNFETNGYLKYALYQTLIGFDRFDSVHSISAKNLTAEKYNQFVWWDCEIYQSPVFYALYPKEAKKLIMYRYNRLSQSKINAINLNEKGAKFAFCSSVLGDECVWKYARHPFLQIHINSDIAYSVINYYYYTNDVDFFIHYGADINIEIMRYFANKVVLIENKYHLLNVTGTDEHHPYINDDAYTNYCVHFIFNKTLELLEKFDINFKLLGEELSLFKNIASNFYLPLLDNGMIPQFEGYFNLSKSLELCGNGASKSFQMKQSGLYNKSQIIKQPDVLVLYSYLNINMPGNYFDNYNYYENICESSSSLTYPVHAICAIDNNDYEKFLDYFNKSIKIDILDLHKCAYQGLHAAAMAGGWYIIYRGLFGFKAFEDYLEVNPHFVKEFGNVSINFYYHNVFIKATINYEQSTIEIISNKEITIKKGHNYYTNTFFTL